MDLLFAVFQILHAAALLTLAVMTWVARQVTYSYVTFLMRVAMCRLVPLKSLKRCLVILFVQPFLVLQRQESRFKSAIC